MLERRGLGRDSLLTQTSCSSQVPSFLWEPHPGAAVGGLGRIWVEGCGVAKDRAQLPFLLLTWVY